MTKLKIYITVLFITIVNINSSKAQQWSTITNNNIWNLNTGNVGIGTTYFTQKLSVYDSNPGIASFFGGKVSNNYQYSQIYLGQHQAAGYCANIGYMAQQTDQTASGLYLTNYGDSEGTTGIFIKKGGNVGIGTTTPYSNSKLEVEGNVFINSGNDDNHIYWGGHNMTMGTAPDDYSHNAFSLKPGGSDTGPLFSILKMYNANSKTSFEQKVQIHTSGDTYFNGGNVGIGTTYFTQKLSVYDSNPGIASFFGGKVSNNYQYSQIYLGQHQAAGYCANIGYMAHQTDQTASGLYLTNYGDREGTTGVFIKKGGNVGIGTSNPVYKLDVLGTIRAQEVLINMDGGADFVFEKDYKLPTIEFVANYVQVNKHLPDIQSANEMVKNGVNMGEMQNKLLQKVEELTLYVIEQEKSKKKLEEKLAKQDNQYNALLEKLETITKQLEKR